MARETTVSIGSGTLPHLTRMMPVLRDLSTEGLFPIGNSKKESLNHLTGSNVVITNPEDFGVRFGIRSQAVTVGSTAVKLPADPPLEFRKGVVIHNIGSIVIYIGGSTVSVAQGFPILAGEKIFIAAQGNPNGTIYAIATDDNEVRVLEVG